MPDVLCLQISLQDQDTKDEFTCEVYDWIAVDDEKDGQKEIPAVWPGTYIPQSRLL